MTTKNIVVDFTKGEKLKGNNYNVWHRKIQYLWNEQGIQHFDGLKAYFS